MSIHSFSGGNTPQVNVIRLRRSIGSTNLNTGLNEFVGENNQTRSDVSPVLRSFEEARRYYEQNPQALRSLVRTVDEPEIPERPRDANGNVISFLDVKFCSVIQEESPIR